MLENEEKNAADRIASLEKRVQQQNDELVCLKSALADVIRRIHQVETTQQQQQHQIYSQLNSTSSPHKTALNTAGKSAGLRKQVKDVEKTFTLVQESKSAGHLNGDASSASAKDAKVAPGKSSEKAKESDRGSEKGGHVSKASQKPSIQATVDFHQQPLNFNSDAGLVKFYLRGRPVSLYLPNSSQASNSNEIGFKFDTESKQKAPKEQLKLEWVYGYRGKDCRSNLYQLPTGEIVYFIAATVILHNVEERIQRHYTGHTDDVKVRFKYPILLKI